MRRSTVHLFFMLVSFCFAAAAAWQAWQLYQHNSVSEAIAAVPATLPEVPAALTEQQAVRSQSVYPQVLLAQATALSSGGQFDAAESILVSLIDQQQFQPLGQAARFNLANHYLREGMRADLPGAQTRPLIEMAKQRYRDLLRADPMDWDARYHLERALVLAPERRDSESDKGPPPKRVRVIVPDFEADNLP